MIDIERVASHSLLTKGHTWIVTDGSIGLQSHAIAVAQAVGLPFNLKRVQVTGLLRCLPAGLQIYLPPARLLPSVASNDALGPPWPRLIIAIGRRSVPIALSLKSLSVPRGFALHIRNRRASARHFDLIVAPMNNAFSGANVMAAFDAVYSVAPMSDANATRPFNDRLESGSYRSINDIEMVASVIIGALGLECPRA